MRHSPTLFPAVLLLLFLGGIHVAQGDDKPTSKDLSKIQPPGGVPLLLRAAGDTDHRGRVEQGEKASGGGAQGRPRQVGRRTGTDHGQEARRWGSKCKTSMPHRLRDLN